jgi:pimeloyl-ACP methyl ester carboxylesterase
VSLPTTQHRRAKLNGVELHWVEAGPVEKAPAVVLLHGFPEFWYGWRHQIPGLAAAGFRVLALDMRGYGESGQPALVGDVSALIAEQCGGRAHVVGHDWGGIVAWYTAMLAPQHVDRLVVLNAPHPAAYLRELPGVRQALRSYYALLFQLPSLPEAFIRLGDFRALRRLFRLDPAQPFAEEEIDAYVRAFDRPRGLSGPINYYRAAFRSGRGGLSKRVRRIDAPTLLLWGMRDCFLVPGLTTGLEAFVPGLRVERHPDATHGVQHDEPDWVNRQIIGFLDDARRG